MKKLLLFLSLLSFGFLSAQEIDDTYYYEYSNITFGTGKTSEGFLTGESTEFILTGKGLSIFMLLEQDDPLMTSKLYMELYEGADFENFVETLEVDIPDVKWNYVIVPLNFDKKGNYIFDVYSHNDTYINSASLVIK